MIQEAQSGACPGEGSQIQEGSRFLATAGVVIVLAVVWMADHDHIRHARQQCPTA